MKQSSAGVKKDMGKDRKTKILQVNKLYYPFVGGIEQVVQQIAEGLTSSVDMKVLVCNESGDTVQEKIHDVDVIRAGSFLRIGNMPLSWKFLREFRKQAADRDVLIFHMPYPLGDLAYLLSGIKGKKVIVWWHSDIVRQKKMMFFYRPLMEWFLKKADRIIVATEGHICGSKYLSAYKDKCVIIPFGVRQEIEEDSFRYLSQQQLRENTDTKVRFLFVGRLVYYKGCDILLKAFEKIDGAELVIVGDGNMKAELERYVQEHHMKEKVCFKAQLTNEEVMEEYRSCDVFVLPSVARSEAFGLVQIEAMAYGKPVINTKLPSGVPYVSVNQVTGLTVPPGHVKELQKAILWMIKHPKEREKMGQEARKRVEEQFLLKQMMEKVMEICSKEHERK